MLTLGSFQETSFFACFLDAPWIVCVHGAQKSQDDEASVKSRAQLGDLWPQV